MAPDANGSCTGFRRRPIWSPRIDAAGLSSIAVLVGVLGIWSAPLSAQTAPVRTETDSAQPHALPVLPTGVTVADLRDGDALFHGRGGCFVCHGVDGRGVTGAGNALTLGVTYVDRVVNDIDSLITNGIPDVGTRSAIAMPARGARSDLTPAETHVVAGYVWAISGVAGEPWEGGHETHGAVPRRATTGADRAPEAVPPLGSLSIFRPAGPAATVLANHGGVLTWIAVAVTGVMLALIAWSLAARAGDGNDAARLGRRLLIGGTVITGVVLTVTFALSVGATARVMTPSLDPAVAVRITAHQWWWEILYLDPDSTRQVVTANELHIPVGRPVEVRLESADVIHSLWVPSLQGKMDAIPGRTNVFWIQADTVGVYRGQCAEYCGLQHANMALHVVAQSSDAFAEWVARQRAPAAPASDPVVALGRDAFAEVGCAVCHQVRGTTASGTAGPDLTHVASRSHLGAGVIPNTRGYLAGWIADAPAIKPGSLMPSVRMSASQINEIVTYLEALR